MSKNSKLRPSFRSFALLHGNGASQTNEQVFKSLNHNLEIIQTIPFQKDIYVIIITLINKGNFKIKIEKS